ncbi:type VI secretion system contractile sheath small subunit [Azospirillum sp. ST 5-10]|uniref:type VI secretion system contractile sheath small subunit n=1 Tax=unclassified Azospirillum TaxID=2630922 RepID=UPI003F49F0BC
MSSESSVAPKERVNIRYRPATGDAKEEVELPLKLLMLGDYTLRPDDTPLEERQRINVDKDNFTDVMRSQNLAVTTSVKNTLAGDDSNLSVSLKFESLKDFEPEQVAEQVPELKTLLELREALNALRGPLGNVPAFRKKIEALLGDEAARSKLLDELKLATEPK